MKEWGGGVGREDILVCGRRLVWGGGFVGLEGECGRLVLGPRCVLLLMEESDCRCCEMVIQYYALRAVKAGISRS